MGLPDRLGALDRWLGDRQLPRPGSSGTIAGWNAVISQYFALETQLAASGAVDVLAHVDLPKKYGHRLPNEPLDHYEAVVAAASASGTAVEVSSQGLRKPAAEVYPSPRFLNMFHEAGVPITLASDGHFPHEAASGGFDAVVGAARAAGYQERVQFRRRAGELVPLDDALHR